jgi:hypothetical protein
LIKAQEVLDHKKSIQSPIQELERKYPKYKPCPMLTPKQYKQKQSTCNKQPINSQDTKHKEKQKPMDGGYYQQRNTCASWDRRKQTSRKQTAATLSIHKMIMLLPTTLLL